MKKLILMTVFALVFNASVGATFGAFLGHPLAGAIALNIFATIAPAIPSNTLNAGVYREIWTGELVKALRARMAGSWLDGVPDHSSVVKNDVIHLVEVGADPDVLINNTTYPIPTQSLTDKDIAISLDKFQTKPTIVTDDELYAISYDKMSRVKESHANAINDAKFKKAAHALCATSNTATTPVLSTTGTRDSSSGRLKMTIADLLNMKAALDKLNVPVENRRLVLCTDHVNDLLSTDQSFREQYNINRNEGSIGRLYGFDIYEYAYTPYYNAKGEKKAVGDAGTSTGDFQCSFAFYTPRVFKATGSTEMYYSEAARNPQNQQSLINYRHYFICMFKKADAGVVMHSAYSAS